MLKYRTIAFFICIHWAVAQAEPLGHRLPELAARPDSVECAFYRHRRFGDPIAEDLRVARWGQPDQTVTIRYRYRYLKQPYVPDTIDGSLPRNQTFRLDPATGRPFDPPWATFRTVRPQDYTHVRMLISAGFNRPIWVHLNRLDELGTWVDHYVDLPNGDRIRRPSEYRIAGPFVSDFSEIVWPFDLGAWNERREYAVAFDAKGEISEILTCARPKAYPNPGCDLQFRIDPLIAKVRFNRRLLDRIDQIRHRAWTFLGCLLQP